MPARSEAQQRLMGMALAAKRGKGHFSGKVKEIANSMTEKQLHDFAATKHKGLPEKKAFIEGFVKRASQYGFNENDAAELLKNAESSWLGRYMAAKKNPELAKQAFLGEPAYKDVPDLSEEELKALSYSDLKKHLEPQKGEGALAHIKRHLGSYALGGLGALAGLGSGAAMDHIAGNSIPADAAIMALLGGTAGGALGAGPDFLINTARKHMVSAKAEKELARLSRHTHARNALNSPSQTNYNRHSL